MPVYIEFEKFLNQFHLSSSPLLLALSGGPDSLCLFYCLLTYRQKHGQLFHLAHVDHGWRLESEEEAQLLQELANKYQVPFHLQTLNPTLLKGNLEAACREERYAFFAAICEKFNLQAVLTGHHQDDQAETIFKRVLEGSHWSQWVGLQKEKWIKGIRVLRPLLKITKQEVQSFLLERKIEAFEDPTNQHAKFLRARLRHSLFPKLNEEFGKKIEKSFIEIGEESQELIEYFNSLMHPLLEKSIEGPWGIYLDLESSLPKNIIEIKYLLRLLSKKSGFFLSREMIAQIAKALYEGKGNQSFAMGRQQIKIDRKKIFILKNAFDQEKIIFQKESIEANTFNKWKINRQEISYSSQLKPFSWKEGWQGHLIHYLPLNNYVISHLDDLKHDPIEKKSIKKKWSQNKVPHFLTSYYPVCIDEKGQIYEFLTGRNVFLGEEKLCLKIELTYLSTKDC